MFTKLKQWLGIGVKSDAKDHRGRELDRGEKTVSARIKEAAASKHSVIRRAPIDMSQGD